MKTIFRIIALVALIALPASAAPAPLLITAGGSIDVGNTISYSVVSANGKNQAAPLLTYINWSSDLATSILTYYTLGNPVQSRFTNSTVTLFIDVTNGVTTNAQIVVIRHT